MRNLTGAFGRGGVLLVCATCYVSGVRYGSVDSLRQPLLFPVHHVGICPWNS